MSPPAAHGVRLPFAVLPEHVRRAVDGICGGGVTVARELTGGFSPGCATLVSHRDTAFFVKAVGAAINADSPAMHRREIAVLRTLADLPVRAPTLIGSFDDGDWVAIVTEAVPGSTPSLPWTASGIDALVRVLDELNELGTTATTLEPLVVEEGETFTGWRSLAAEPAPAVDSWTRSHLDALAELETGWVAAAEGEGLLHNDIRADNMLVADGDARLVDWSAAAKGHPLFDIVAAAPCVAMQGGPPPSELLARTVVGRAADPDQLRVLVVAVTGYFLAHAALPAPPGLPTVREFQRAQGVVALRWVRTLLA